MTYILPLLLISLYQGGNNMKKHAYTESGEINFSKLKERTLLANDKMDKLAEETALIISKINEPTIIVATGGSVVVAKYLKEVLERYRIICEVVEPRTINYKENLNSFKNLICISYSGNTNGISNALEKFQGNKYLLTGKKQEINGATISLESTVEDNEKSFVSLATTLIPMELLLKSSEIIDGTYSKKDMKSYLEFTFNNSEKYSNYPFNFKNLGIEVMSGSDTACPATTLESNLIESGTTPVVIHDKGSFCHGRSNLINNNPTNAMLYLNHSESELDKLLLELLKSEYPHIINLTSPLSVNSQLRKEFSLNLDAIYLSQKIASDNDIDMCMVDYNPKVINKIYKYRGEM